MYAFGFNVSISETSRGAKEWDTNNYHTTAHITETHELLATRNAQAKALRQTEGVHAQSETQSNETLLSVENALAPAEGWCGHGHECTCEIISDGLGRERPETRTLGRVKPSITASSR